MHPRITPARLQRVWMNRRFTTEEVCAILKLTEQELRRLAVQQRLPRRHFVYRMSLENEEPGPEALEEIERRKRECREAHYKRRRSESDDSTRTKVGLWRAG